MSVPPPSSTAPDALSALPRPASSRDLFVTFTLMALQGFGGVLAVAQRTLCERKRWLTRDEFVELLAVAQVLPGPNVVNLAILIGDRFLGARGAAAALSGMILVPLVIVLALTALYAGFAHQPAVAGALRGMAAVSAGLIFGTAIKLAGSLRASPMGAARCALVGVAAFVLVAWLRLPLLWVIAAVGSVSMLLAWRALQVARQAGGVRR